MIDLYSWSTANGRKISILLEEMNISYKVFDIDITKDEQFTKKFSLISPSNKIPAIVDKENGKNIFESGAIMLYLSTKYNQFIPQKHYWEIMKWFFFQISQVGPFLGQAHQYLYYHSGKSPFAGFTVSTSLLKAPNDPIIPKPKVTSSFSSLETSDKP